MIPIFLFCSVPFGQWEYQVGPTVGIAAGDQVWISRYILEVPSNSNIQYEKSPFLFFSFAR